MELLLVRYGYLPDVTLGRLFVDRYQLWTLEEPWRPDPDGPGGEAFISCVPDGVYELRPHSGRFPDTFALHNPTLGVWHQKPADVKGYGRGAVLIHAGNDTDDIEGCILLGLSTGYDGGRHRVNESAKALNKFKSLCPRVPGHKLTIRSIRGTAEGA